MVENILFLDFCLYIKNKWQARLMPIANKIGNQKFLVALRDSFIGTMPVIMTGSFALMVNKMQKAAEERGLAATIFAVPVSEAEDYLSEKKVDVLLLGPQVRYLLENLQEKLASKGIPVDVIPMTDYGMMKGDKVLDLAESLMK